MPRKSIIPTHHCLCIPDNFTRLTSQLLIDSKRHLEAILDISFPDYFTDRLSYYFYLMPTEQPLFSTIGFLGDIKASLFHKVYLIKNFPGNAALLLLYIKRVLQGLYTCRLQISIHFSKKSQYSFQRNQWLSTLSTQAF